jgi:oligopeptide/dipeptide ABC transporter ATP-binding protein
MNVLEVEGLRKWYPIRKGLMQRQVSAIKAVDDVSLHLGPGETLSLVGESGCGKTTVSRCILRALRPTAGQIRFRAGDSLVDLAPLSRRELRPIRPHLQMIFQDPNSSLNPRMTVGEIVAEPLLINGIGTPAERRKRVLELFDLVRLPRSAYTRYPHAFSGGQRQRVGIARALALRPRVIVADEPVSALDVSVQAQIVNLLLELQQELKLSYLFVAHDLGVVKHMSDRVAVMYVGRIVETGPAAEIFAAPKHPYTAALLASVPIADPRARAQRVPLRGEVADPARPPPGCAFHPRCPYAADLCRTTAPPEEPIGAGRSVRCHRARELDLPGV